MALFLVLSTIVDILKVVIGVEEFEAVPGLAESIFIVEGVEFLTDLLLTGTLFTVLPALYLVPRLYGKVEPLLGLKPRTADNFSVSDVITPKFISVSALLSLVAFGIALLSEMDFNLGAWEPEFVDTYGNGFIWGVIGVAVVCVCITLWLMMKKGRKIHMTFRKPLIECRDLTFRYPGKKQYILKDLTCTINEGEFLAIIGGNGSGKSTLCKAFNGLIPHFYVGDYTGEVTLDGVSTATTDVATLSQSIGYVYQDFQNQLLRPTALEDACFMPLNYGLR